MSRIRIVAALGVAALLAASAQLPVHASTGFAYRGVIEGFYGPPWPMAARAEFLSWMLDHGMNLYIHAPKNDPYQRLRWRVPYPQQEIDQFAAEIALVGGGLAWVPSISPGSPLIEAAQEHDVDICFSCEADFSVVVAKLDQFWDIGARTLMVSFDDVVKASTHPEDALAYGVGDYAYGVMNGDLLNRLFDHYRARAAADGSSFRLITVPADYFGVSTTPYLEGLRATLYGDPAIIVMWTGVLVVSPTISCTEADGFAAAIGRKPLLWDNFPVNDYAMPGKLMLGPYAGRATDLPDCLAGIAANPANQVVANEIPLFTVADYLNDPAVYDREASWEASLSEFAPARALAGTAEPRALLGHFVENVRSTALDRTEAVRFAELSDAFLTALDTPDWPLARAPLVAELEATRDAPEAIRGGFHAQLVRDFECVFAFQSAADDCQGSWLQRLAFNAANGLETTERLTRTRPDVDGVLSGGVLHGTARPPADPDEAQTNAQTLGGMRNRDDGNPVNVYGDRAFFALGPTYVEENRLDAYFADAVARAAAYAPTAALASSSLAVTVNGVPVAVAPDGTFQAAVAGEVADVVVTDGAGAQTHRQFFVCGLTMCGSVPLSGCRQQVEPQKGALIMKDKAQSQADRLIWKWNKGAATAKGDFGTPLTTTDYELCVYDGPSQLVAGVCAPADGNCGGKPCWKETSKGFKYRRRDVSGAGLKNSLQLVLKSGLAGKARITVKGKGGTPPIPPLPIAHPVTVQLVNGRGVCWEETYSAPALRNDAAQFKDTAD